MVVGFDQVNGSPWYCVGSIMVNVNVNNIHIVFLFSILVPLNLFFFSFLIILFDQYYNNFLYVNLLHLKWYQA